MSDDQSYPEIGHRLRCLRKHLGYTIKEFADINGWGKSQVQNWESGHRRIPVEAAAKLRDRYSTSLDWIYLGREDSLPQNLSKSLSLISRDLS